MNWFEAMSKRPIKAGEKLVIETQVPPKKKKKK